MLIAYIVIMLGSISRHARGNEDETGAKGAAEIKPMIM